MLLNAIYGKSLHTASNAPAAAPTSLAARRLGVSAPTAVMQQYIRPHGRRAGFYRVFWRRIANRGDGVVTAWNIESVAFDGHGGSGGAGGFRVWDGGREDPAEGMVKDWGGGAGQSDPAVPTATEVSTEAFSARHTAADPADIDADEAGEGFDDYADYLAWAARRRVGGRGPEGEREREGRHFFASAAHRRVGADGVEVGTADRPLSARPASSSSGDSSNHASGNGDGGSDGGSDGDSEGGSGGDRERQGIAGGVWGRRGCDVFDRLAATGTAQIPAGPVYGKCPGSSPGTDTGTGTRLGLSSRRNASPQPRTQTQPLLPPVPSLSYEAWERERGRGDATVLSYEGWDQRRLLRRLAHRPLMTPAERHIALAATAKVEVCPRVIYPPCLAW